MSIIVRWRGIMRESPNFQFLKVHDPQLVRLASLAEGSLHIDPPTTILKVRQFVEILARHVAAKQGALSVSGETLSDLLRRLQETGRLPREAAEVFHHLRRLGNAAAHENRGSALQALSSLRACLTDFDSHALTLAGGADVDAGGSRSLQG